MPEGFTSRTPDKVPAIGGLAAAAASRVSTGPTTAGFSRDLIPVLVCQHDGGSLRVVDEKAGDDRTISNAALRCQSCDAVYRIRDGIADFLSHQQEQLDDVMRFEIAFRDQRATGYDQEHAPRFYKEVRSTLRALGRVDGKRLIEFGCGTGRATTSLLRAEVLLAVDFSWNSLSVLSQKVAGHPNLGLVLADASTFRTKPATFDLALSAQVYEHIDSPERRISLLSGINHALAENGRLVLTAYHYDRRRRRRGLPKHGRHRTGITYQYFTVSDLRDEVGSVLLVDDVYPIDITLPFESRLHLPLRVGGWISSMSRRMPILGEFGELVLAKARKKT